MAHALSFSLSFDQDMHPRDVPLELHLLKVRLKVLVNNGFA